MKASPGPTSIVLWGIPMLFLFWAASSPRVGLQLSEQPPSRFELIHADLTRVQMENGTLLRILEGHVHARQDTLEIFCDRAVYNQQKQMVLLEGHVILQRGQETLRAEKVTYYQNIQKAIATGQVEVVRKNRLLRTPYLEYYYDSDQSLARSGVYLKNEEEKVEVTAQEGQNFPAAGRSVVTGRAHFVQARPEQDTLHIFAHRLEYWSGEPRRAVAVDSVRIVQGTLEARCDSAIYFLDQQRAHLEGSPVARQGEHIGRGNRMVVQFREGEIQQISILGAAQFESPADSLSGQINRLTGKTIFAFFKSGELREVRAIGQARSRYLFSESSGEKGINVATADTIKVFLHNSALDSIAVLGGAEGTFYPEGVPPPPE
ncbi:MAG: hypothetical protein D6715_14330 [Calditrichaeota bacterium]|nr:MAG: hypothetical protein D6715_14330 [Calditrichota bacterium]